MEKLDFLINSDGDLVLEQAYVQGIPTESYNFSYVDSDDLIAQIAYNRIKSIKDDWVYDHIGADLEEVLGFPPVDDTNTIICEKIVESLTYDGFFKRDDIFIEIEFQNTNEIMYKIYIRTLDKKSARIINVYIDLTQNLDISLG